MPKPRPGARSLHKGLDGAPQNRRYTHVKAWFYTLLRRKILNQIRNNKQGVKRFRRLTGETKRIVLPDAPVVVLNGNSELRIAKTWLPDSVRPVWLGGDGYFEVTKQKGQFIVHTATMEVKVLGTKFNVNAYTNEPSVALKEGAVEVVYNQQADSKMVKAPVLPAYPLRTLLLRPQPMRRKRYKVA